MLLAQACERRARRAEHAVAAVRRGPQRGAERRHRLAALALVGRAHDQVDERRHRRVAHGAAELQLALEEGVVVLRARVYQRVVVGHVRLQDHLARRVAAPRAPRHLRQQLEGALGRAEVGDAEAHVGVDHARPA